MKNHDQELGFIRRGAKAGATMVIAAIALASCGSGEIHDIPDSELHSPAATAQSQPTGSEHEAPVGGQLVAGGAVAAIIWAATRMRQPEQ